MSTPRTDDSPKPSSNEASDSRGTRTLHSLDELRDAVNACRRCDLYKHATQGVPGEGDAHAKIVLVGEAPGDSEDVAGHPFVGPAGTLLSRALKDAGLERDTTFVTNAVKHFKFERRGKRRLHIKPSVAEIKACNWWLGQELQLLKPRLILALGATAARAVLGKATTVSNVRGSAMPLAQGGHVWVTIHPSYLLRIPEEAGRRAEYLRFVNELKDVGKWLGSGAPVSGDR